MADTVIMRALALTVVGMTMLAACGAEARQAAPTDPLIDPATETTLDIAVPGTDAEPLAPTTTLPSPNDVAVTDQLSIAAALLPDDAFAPPWELQWRDLDRLATPAGPNQTTCPPYWELELLLGREGGHVMWWIDGGNANHHVARVDPFAIKDALGSIAAIADECPTVKWLEGGQFTTARLPVDEAIALRFVEDGGTQVTVALIASRGDLVSILHMPLWAPGDGGPMPEPSPNELALLAQRMTRQLAHAGSAGSVPTTTEPGRAPATTTPRSVTTDPPVQPTGLGKLLLTQGELPAGWTLDDIDEYTADGGEEPLAEVCPAAGSIDVVDAVLTWEATFFTEVNEPSFQAIGAMGSAEEAASTVADFAQIADCDLTAMLEDMGNTTWSGGAEVIPGADVAGRLTVEAPDLEGRFELVLIAVGPIVSVVSAEGDLDQPSVVVDLAARAAAKIAAGR